MALYNHIPNHVSNIAGGFIESSEMIFVQNVSGESADNQDDGEVFIPSVSSDSDVSGFGHSHQ